MAKGIGRALLLIGTWALVYALPAVPLEGLPNLGVRLPAWAYEVDMWPQTLALPGLIAGSLFLGLLAVAGRMRDFELISTGKLVAWGALAGVVAGGVVLAVLGGEPIAVTAVILIGATALGALAGPASALVFRFLARRGNAPAAARG